MHAAQTTNTAGGPVSTQSDWIADGKEHDTSTGKSLTKWEVNTLYNERRSNDGSFEEGLADDVERWKDGDGEDSDKERRRYKFADFSVETDLVLGFGASESGISVLEFDSHRLKSVLAGKIPVRLRSPGL